MNKPNRKKLIEVALPLEAINEASGREKSIRHGHPSTLHLWWARRPLAAARAVIFAQMVDDPSSWPDLFPTEKAQQKERQRLFDIIEELVKWESTSNEPVLQKARDEIWRSWRRACAENVDHPRAKDLFDRESLPAFHDPFAGGGALPLEAQRLGLESFASDLNPVAVLINKAMIEIPPRFSGQPPVNPESRKKPELFRRDWKGAEGLAEDIRYYGRWLRDEAVRRIGHAYPNIKVTPEMVVTRPELARYLNSELNVIAWIWARTVKSPNPAFREVDVPLVSTFFLSTKAGKEVAISPVFSENSYSFELKMGKDIDLEAAKSGTKLAQGSNFACLMSGAPISSEYIKAEAQQGRLGQRLIAVVADGARSRLYFPGTSEIESVATACSSHWKPETRLPDKALGFSVQLYFNEGTYGDLFTERQLLGLSTVSDLIQEAIPQIEADAALAGLRAEEPGVEAGGKGARAYAEAVATYLAFALDKSVDGSSSLCRWMVQRDSLFSTFGRQALPMTWDFAEVNLLADCTRSISESIAWTAESIEGVGNQVSARQGFSIQLDAAKQTLSMGKVVSTDPPYFDNIGYADLSEFFYVWLRRPLKSIFPSLFATLATPKDTELVATPSRHGGRAGAEEFFLNGMTEAMGRLAEGTHPAFPVSIYYAFRQSESSATGGTSSTGWETFLGAVIAAGFQVTGTWPIRTEREIRSRSIESNALASSIILVCRKREVESPTASRREFLTALEKELPIAIANLQRGNVAPVDLQQASIGPGMAIFTRFARVLDADGKPLSVRDALATINQALDEILAHQEGDFDSDTRWALAWFEQFGFAEGDYGVAETLSKAKNTSVDGIRQAGIGTHGKGKVRLYKPEELPADWSPESDSRLTVWDMVHHLIRTLEQGEEAAGRMLAKLGSQADIARELAYRLYSICERKKRSGDAQRYNALVSSWPELVRLAQQAPRQEQGPQQSFEGMN